MYLVVGVQHKYRNTITQIPHQSRSKIAQVPLQCHMSTGTPFGIHKGAWPIKSFFKEDSVAAAAAATGEAV